MTWFLIMYVVYSSGIDPGIIQGYVAPTKMVQLVMPSQEVCEQIKQLNRFQSAECWAKMDAPKEGFHFN
jgi:hypothetical protein